MALDKYLIRTVGRTLLSTGAPATVASVPIILLLTMRTPRMPASAHPRWFAVFVLVVCCQCHTARSTGSLPVVGLYPWGMYIIDASIDPPEQWYVPPGNASRYHVLGPECGLVCRPGLPAACASPTPVSAAWAAALTNRGNFSCSQVPPPPSPGPTPVHPDPAMPLVLFADRTALNEALTDPRLTMTVHRPTHGGRVLWPTKPWESYMVYAYNQVLDNGPGDARLYYDCIEGDMAVSPPRQLARRVCMAHSTDSGLTWAKPNLGVYEWGANGSTDNNIIMWTGAMGSVFVDQNPAAPPAERFKLVVATTDAQDDWNQTGAVWASPDGISNWKSLPFTKLHDRDDTQPVANWDPGLQRYVIMVRRDVPSPGKGADVIRHIGRCATKNISDWQAETNERPCPVIFGPDDVDPDHADFYTSAWTPYPSASHAVVHLFFPSMMGHFSASKPGPPFGFADDALVDVRLVVSRDGVNLGYPPATNARAPFVPLGVNKCGALASRPSVKGGWCDPGSGVESTTSWDTSNLYMCPGYLPSADGTELHLFVAGQPFTHGDGLTNHSFGNNTGIGILKLRRDGFVSIDAPYGFYGQDLAAYPSLTTTAVLVPPLETCNAGEDLFVRVNALTSSVGWVRVELLAAGGLSMQGAGQGTGAAVEEEGGTRGDPRPVWNGTAQSMYTAHARGVEGGAGGKEGGALLRPLDGFGVNASDPLVGNFIMGRATWRQGTVSSLAKLAGTMVVFRVTMVDASLYSVTTSCDTP